MRKNQKSKTNYLHHYYTSTGVRKIHSPFVYRFYTEVLKDRKQDFKHLSKSERLFRRLIIHFQVSSFFEIGKTSRPFIPPWGGNPFNYMVSTPKEGIKKVVPKEEVLKDLPLKSIMKLEPEKLQTTMWDEITKGKKMIFTEDSSGKEVFDLFKEISPKVENDTFLTIKGIHHSVAMEKAWEQIKESSIVTLTIDIFHFGFAFFKNEIIEKQHFKLRY